MNKKNGIRVSSFSFKMVLHADENSAFWLIESWQAKIPVFVCFLRAFCCACANKVCSARSAPFSYFQRASAHFQLGDRHLFVIFFGEGWKCMTSLPPFLTLWILVVFAGSSDEYILMIKVRTKREKRPKTWSLRFDLLTIKMCIWDYKSSRLISRCSCLTSMNYEVVCGDDREIFVSVIEGSLEFDLTLLQLWNKIA